MARENLEIVITAKDRASRVLSGISGSLTSIGKVVAGGALAGVAGLGAAFAAVAVPGFQLNNALEQASARIQAFTKDSEETARILDLVKTRAAATPFAFQAMANATANLLPVAKSSNIALEELQQTAEILAASNPAEGLEGAAFSLKEALSGDFVSIVERFNLPRKFINDLKEQGVPDLQIVQRAMAQLGLDTSLVTNLAQTAQGRWSTFTDTLAGLSANVTGGIFEGISSGLGMANEALDGATPRLEEFTSAIGEKLGEVAGNVIPPLIDAFMSLTAPDITTGIVQLGLALGDLFGEDFGQAFIDFAINALVEFNKFKEGAEPGIQAIKDSFGRLGEAATDLIGLVGPDSLSGFSFSDAAISSVNLIASGIEATARAVETLVGLTDQFQTIAGIMEGLGAQGSMEAAFGTTGAGAIREMGRGSFEEQRARRSEFMATGQTPANSILGDISSLFTSMPPAQVDVTVLVDGADVASQMNVRQGAAAQGEFDMGGRANQ